MKRNRVVEEQRCSFCHKRQEDVGKLISSPSDDPPRSYICDECIAVCISILEDERLQTHSAPPIGAFRNHPRAVELLDAVEQWINLEADPHGDAPMALFEVRRIADGMKADVAVPDSS